MEAKADTLYMSVEEAADWAGIGRNAMRDFADSADPPPMLVIGSRRPTKYIQRAGLPAYLERKQNHVEKGR